MADKNIKKIVVSKNDLPPVNSDEEKYIVRFRIVSEDRNRSSHWSPQYLISPKPLAVEAYKNLTVTKLAGLITLTWDPETVAVNQPNYDIFVAWGTGTIGEGVGAFEYYATVSTNFAVIPIPTGKTTTDIIIQTASYPRKVIDSLKIADTGVIATV